MDFKIKMLQTVKPGFPFMVKPGSILWEGGVYDATSNQHGAICGISEAGVSVGVRPGEFCFVCAPMWVVSIWERVYPAACYGCTVSDLEAPGTTS